MEIDKPSLHHALVLSLPGAALLSLPVGIWVHQRFGAVLGLPSLLPSSPSPFQAIGIMVFLVLLSMATLLSSRRAAVLCWQQRGETLRAVVLFLLNILALLAGIMTAPFGAAYLMFAAKGY